MLLTEFASTLMVRLGRLLDMSRESSALHWFPDRNSLSSFNREICTERFDAERASKSFQSSRTSSIFFMMEIPYSTENVGRYAEVPRKSSFPRCNSQMLRPSLSSG